MRITFVLATIDVNGGTKVIAEYGRHLIALGHDVKFITISDPAPSLYRRLLDRLAGKKRQALSTEYFADLADRLIWLSKKQALDYSRFPDADFMIATWWESVEWANGAPASAGRLAHLVQGYEMFPFMPLDRVSRVYEQDILKISVSQWIADQVKLHHGKDVEAVIHNSVDATLFGMKTFAAHQPLRLGFVYSPFGGKNTVIVPQIHAALQRRGIEAEFVTFHVDPITQPEFAALPMQSHLRPPQSSIPGLYQSCDLWLWPSLEEGFGLPLLEALSSGTPVVAGPAGAAPQLIQPQVNGYLSEPTAEAFADHIEHYSRLSVEERKAMSQNARNTVLGWSWRDAARQLESVLQKHL